MKKEKIDFSYEKCKNREVEKNEKGQEIYSRCTKKSKKKCNKFCPRGY